MKYPADHRRWTKNSPIRMTRRMLGASVKEIAALLGVPIPTYWSWEIGRRRPREESMEDIAHALKISPIKLVKEYEIWKALRP